jgi:hypothetical protein
MAMSWKIHEILYNRSSWSQNWVVLRGVTSDTVQLITLPRDNAEVNLGKEDENL